VGVGLDDVVVDVACGGVVDATWGAWLMSVSSTWRGTRARRCRRQSGMVLTWLGVAMWKVVVVLDDGGGGGNEVGWWWWWWWERNNR
jgi:hypothetical protein